MRTFVREYGVVTMLIIVGLAGYFLYDQNRDDILAYSLDAVGERLVAMVDDPVVKEAIASRFDRYKQQVLHHDVAPEQVEQFAANVLNLSNSGARLTPEEAEMVLDDAMRLPAPAPEAAPAQATPSRPPAPGELQALGERLTAIVTFHREMQDAIASEEAVRREWVRHVRFVAEEGLHVVVSPELSDAVRQRASRRLAREVERMEKGNVLVWKTPSIDTTPSTPPTPPVPEVAQSEVQLAEGMSTAQRAKLVEQVKRLEALKHLEAMGYETSVDVEALAETLEVHLAVLSDSIEVQVERAVRLRDEAASVSVHEPQ